MPDFLEYEYVHIDSDFILIGLTILHTSVIHKIATYVYLSYSKHDPIKILSTIQKCNKNIRSSSVEKPIL